MADEELPGGSARAAGEALETGSATAEAPSPGRERLSRRDGACPSPRRPRCSSCWSCCSSSSRITSPYFFNADNLVNILQNVARIGIVACPATLLLDQRPVRPVGRLDRRVRGDGHGRPGRRPPACTKRLRVRSPARGGARLRHRSPRILVGVINAVSVTVFRINALITTLGHAGHLPRADQGARQRPDDPDRRLRRPGHHPVLGHPVPGLHLRRHGRRVLRHPAVHDLRTVDVRHRRQPDRRASGRHPDRIAPIFIGFLLSALPGWAVRADPAVAGRRRVDQRRTSAWSSRS